MKPGIPWSVKGIGPEVREAAKHAARRSGMTLGEWLNTLILDQSAESGGPEVPPAPLAKKVFSPATRAPQASPGRRDDTALRLEDIAQQLARLAQRDQDAAAIDTYEEPPARQRDADMLSRILDRVDGNERQTVDAFTAVNERLSVLGRQISQAARHKAFDKPEDVPGYPALETALRNVVDHIEVSEKRTRDSLKSLQERLSEMAERANSSASEDINQSAPALVSLEARLSELADRVLRSEDAAPDGLQGLVRQELSHLSERIESVRETSEILAQQVQSSAVHAAQQELHDIEARILKLLNEAHGTLSSAAGNGAALERVRGEIGDLNERIDEVKVASATGYDVEALRVAVEQLSTRVAQGPDLRPLADIDRRLAEVTRRLDDSEIFSRTSPQLGELERKVSELDHRLGEAVRLQDDHGAIAALEQQIVAVDQRVQRTEKQFGHLESIERSIAQLFESLEQSRKLAHEVAEEAAGRVADRILKSQVPALGPSPELLALEEGLRAVRASADSSEQRNQETLSAVHDTLEQIVAKLTELETATAGHHLAAAMAQQATAAFAPAPEAAAEAPFPVPEAAANPFADFNLEEQPAATEQPLPQMDPPVTAPADDFIAAARRAAHAAAGKTVFQGHLPSGKAVLAKSGFRFIKPKGTPLSAAVPGSSQAPFAAAANSNTGKRRRLLFAGIVLLAAASAFTFNLVARSAKSPPAPAKVQSMMAPAKSMKPPVTTTGEAEMPNGLPPRGMERGKSTAVISDGFVTGSLPAQKTDTSLAQIVAEPGLAMEQPEPPAADIGPQSLRDAAALGDARAQFIIASRYLDGKPVEQDLTKAAYWYQQAASRGLAPAQYRIATLFERGKGVPQDAATALLWYERAAGKGHVKAMHNAAVIAAGNQAGPPDYKRAFKLFSAAAAHGLKDSQFNLAVLYERGLGSGANSREALFWFLLAARQNDPDARKRGNDIALGMAVSAVEEVTRRVETWRPEPTLDDANVVAVTVDGWQEPIDIDAPAAPARQSLATDPVTTAQQLLATLGLLTIEPGSPLGPRTANAIRLFQLQTGLNVTGEVTPELILDMQAKLA